MKVFFDLRSPRFALLARDDENTQRHCEERLVATWQSMVV